jgi:hypothetical protein
VEVSFGLLSPLPGSPFAVPSQGELHVPITLTDDWLLIETMAPTEGLVEPYLISQRAGPDVETTGAAVLATTQSAIPIHPNTDGVLFFNNSKFAGAPTAADFVFTFHATDGSATPIPVPLVGTVGTAFVPVPLGSVGHLSVVPAPFPQTAPAGTEFAFTLATHEDADIVLDVDEQRRRLDDGASAQADLLVDFGQDAEGNYHDFDQLVSNVSDATAALTILNVYTETGQVLLPSPRVVTLAARETRLFATNLSDSLGLELGETHPFADVFGDVFAAGGFGRYRFDLLIDEGIFLTARQFDPLAGDFAGRVRPQSRNHVQGALVFNAQTTADGGITNELYLTNSSAGQITVNVRAFTRTEGTEYMLSQLVVPARSTVAWSPDGLGLRETPGDVVAPPVRDFRFLFSSNGPLNVFGRQRIRNGADLIVVVTPHVVIQED